MPEEINTNWDIVITPQEDGTVRSRHIGLTLAGAVAVLKAVLKDYKRELKCGPSSDLPAQPSP